MARGKYATLATGRREAAEVEASEAAYRRQIVRLTEERDDARRALEKSKTDHAAEVQTLRAYMSEATSPQVQALKYEMERIRSERDALERRRKESRKLYSQVFNRLREHMQVAHGAKTPRHATELAYSTFYPGGEDGALVYDNSERKFAEAFGDEAVEVLRSVRGGTNRMPRDPAGAGKKEPKGLGL